MCREMRIVYEQMESELTATKERLALKDEEMIRLAHETTELNTEILQKEQELDQLRHYASSSDSNALIQAELQQSKQIIQQLNARVAELNALGRVETPEESADELSTIEEGRYAAETEEMVKEIDILKLEKAELLKVINDFRTKVPEVAATPVKSSIKMLENGSGPEIMPPEEALMRLQVKFKRTMEEFELLMEEKDRLEHLVIQLQFETETIGEYITLYQNQRRSLKEKDLERNRELQQLANDRETLKQKLLELNELIEQLMTEKRRLSVVVTPPTTPDPLMMNGNTSPIPFEEQREEARPQRRHHHETARAGGTKLDTKETANKILALLADIQNVNHPPKGVDHCSCCQGKLDVV